MSKEKGELEAKCTALEAKCTELQAELDSTKSQAEESKQLLTDADESNKTLEANTCEMKAKLAELEQELDSIKVEQRLTEEKGAPGCDVKVLEATAQELGMGAEEYQRLKKQALELFTVADFSGDGSLSHTGVAAYFFSSGAV